MRFLDPFVFNSMVSSGVDPVSTDDVNFTDAFWLGLGGSSDIFDVEDSGDDGEFHLFISSCMHFFIYFFMVIIVGTVSFSIPV